MYVYSHTWVFGSWQLWRKAKKKEKKMIKNVSHADFMKWCFSSHDTISYSLSPQIPFHKDKTTYHLVVLFYLKEKLVSCQFIFIWHTAQRFFSVFSVHWTNLFFKTYFLFEDILNLQTNNPFLSVFFHYIFILTKL